MNRAHYYIVGGRIHHGGLKEYGIICIWKKNNCTESKRIDNITPNLAKLSRYVRLLNKRHAAPVHFQNLVEDFIAI